MVTTEVNGIQNIVVESDVIELEISESVDNRKRTSLNISANSVINGFKLLTASEVAVNYIIEKEVRKASGNKELQCPDNGCSHPTLRYCHGDIKDAFFAHLSNETCDYAIFDKDSPQIVRTIRRVLYDNFKKQGYKVRLEAKVLDHHYTHLLFDMPGIGLPKKKETQTQKSMISSWKNIISVCLGIAETTRIHGQLTLIKQDRLDVSIHHKA